MIFLNRKLSGIIKSMSKEDLDSEFNNIINNNFNDLI
jgi:hypothetical protein